MSARGTYDPELVRQSGDEQPASQKSSDPRDQEGGQTFSTLFPEQAKAWADKDNR